MAKFETTVKGALEELKDYITENEVHFGRIVVKGEELEGFLGDTWYWIITYSRTSALFFKHIADDSDLMVTLTIMLMQQGDDVRVSAITSMGDHRSKVKEFAISRENEFMEDFVEIITGYEAEIINATAYEE